MIFSYSKIIYYDSVLLTVERADLFPDHIVHRAESSSYVLIFGSGFVIDVVLCMSANTSGTKSNHTGL